MKPHSGDGSVYLEAGLRCGRGEGWWMEGDGYSYLNGLGERHMEGPGERRMEGPQERRTEESSGVRTLQQLLGPRSEGSYQAVAPGGGCSGGCRRDK
jgi:hypothetical protein